MRIAITGASGLLGTALVPFLNEAGHSVRTLVRRAPEIELESFWDPSAGTLDPSALERIEAVIHLSGRNIAQGRWSDENKRSYIFTRVEPTKLLCNTLSRLNRPPAVLISASATGFYGDRGDELLTESSPKGIGFLPDLCEEWEAATAPASAAGIRVVHLRLGVVLSRKGGALRQVLNSRRFFIGGIVGPGPQYLSWISLPDTVAAIAQCLSNPLLHGPVNAVSPNPVTQREFSQTLTRLLHKLALPIPAWAIKLLLGEKGQTLLLSSARVLPAKLIAAGFEFIYPTLDAALQAELQPL
jgi:uncharacterized protein (TIGR01777 family)